MTKREYLRFMPLLLLVALGCAPAQIPHYNKASAAWEQVPLPPDSLLQHTVFLLGDAGKPQLQPLEPAFVALRRQMQLADSNSAIVYLGDNIYPHGMPAPNHPERKTSEKYLKAQLDLLKNFKGKGYFVNGNHDWAQTRPEGYRNVLYAQEFMNSYMPERAPLLLPQNGCPGPVEIHLTDDITLLLVDTQWWLHPYQKPGEGSVCENQTDEEFLTALRSAVNRNRNKHVIVSGHHPMFSAGPHGRHSKLRNHLFPLADVKDKLYVPLLGLGSAYVFYRSVVGNIQDIPHPRYMDMRRAFLRIFSAHPDLVYTCGHEHSLQYFQEETTHFIVSGSGCKETSIAKRQKANFAYGKKGFARINYYSNGDVWARYFVPEKGGKGEREVYRTRMYNTVEQWQTAQLAERPVFEKPYVDIAATSGLSAKGLKKVLLGSNYRKAWETELQNVPTLDLHKELGGLKIKQLGGGMQTRSLRLEDKQGRQYMLRSIQKFPQSVLPPEFQGTLAQRIVEDQISGAHPYGAFAVPRMAEAAGILHTNPRLFYVPKDNRLGEYEVDFIPGLYLLEERPNGNDWVELESFGNAEDIESTTKLFEELRNDNDNYVDQPLLVRNRLFDILLGDWDRHSDQWRWAEYKERREGSKSKRYVPIPRDRDQVFFDSDGWLMNLGSRKWGVRKFQGFREEIRDPEGLAFNARHLDRRLLTGSSWEEWERQARYLQEQLTDEVIEAAVADMPEEVQGNKTKQIVRKLKARRDALVEVARELYEALAERVNIFGSDKHEYFVVERLNDEQTRVRVYKSKHDELRKGTLLYDRTFSRRETEEIRLYGFDGNDYFELNGQVDKGIKIRIIGGDGEDEVVNKSEVSGWSDKLYVYDLPTTPLTTVGDTEDEREATAEVNSYRYKAFEYDVAAPVSYLGFNPDDGLFLGGGIQFRQHGFRKEPFARRYLLRANYAPKTGAYNFNATSEFTELFGEWDLEVNAVAKMPSFVDFFYGLGNETESFRDELGSQYHRVRYRQLKLSPHLILQPANRTSRIALGGSVERITLQDFRNPQEPSARFVTNYFDSPDSLRLFDDGLYFATADAQIFLDARDDRLLPNRGVTFEAGASYTQGLRAPDSDDISFARLHSAFALYLSQGQQFRTTVALRVGGAINLGEYAFFQANTLGGLNNLRGHHRMRFAGDRTTYFNSEIRTRLFRFRTPLFNGLLGVNGIFDTGRVWFENEEGFDPSVDNGTAESELWHQGYGGGIWVAPFQYTLIAFDITRGRQQEDWLPFLRFGFMF